MQISNHVYAKKMHFTGGNMVRTVYVYLVTGEKTSVLIDTGVFPSLKDVLAFISDAGKTPEDISEILISHAHTDHIGALHSLKEQLNCPAASSELSALWIEDVDKQFHERPVPNFKEFVESSAVIERNIQDGDVIQLGGSTLVTHAAPGHERGQLAFFHQEDGVLFTADSIPVPGEMPVYEDLSAELATLRRLQAVEGIKVLLMSWDDPHEGTENISKVFDDALAYVQRIHSLTLEGIGIYGEDDLEAVTKYVHGVLGLPAGALNALFTGTIKAHISEKELTVNL